MNILIADTDSITVEQLSSVMNQVSDDWNVSAAISGLQCLRAIKSSSSPDAIIIGSNLSDISGLKLIELIRNDSDVPVFYISDNKDICTLVNAFDSGATDYIVKPFNVNIFMARFKAAIRRMKWNIETNSDSHVFTENNANEQMKNQIAYIN